TAITRSTTGQARAAATVSAAIASASAGRCGPARTARRDLARASTLTGNNSDQVSGGAAGWAGLPRSLLGTAAREPEDWPDIHPEGGADERSCEAGLLSGAPPRHRTGIPPADPFDHET